MRRLARAGGMGRALTSSGKGSRIPVRTVNVAAGESIQDAIDAITDASASKPYVVRLAAGTWLLGAVLVCAPWVSLQGSGRATTTITRNAVNAPVIQAANGITISHLTVTNSGGRGITDNEDVALVNASWQVQNCAFVVKSSPVRLTRAGQTVLIRECTATVGTYGYYNAAASAMTLVDSTVTHDGDYLGGLLYLEVPSGAVAGSILGINLVLEGSSAETTTQIKRLVSAGASGESTGWITLHGCTISGNYTQDLESVRGVFAVLRTTTTLYGCAVNVTNAGAAPTHDLYQVGTGVIRVDGDSTYATSYGTITAI